MPNLIYCRIVDVVHADRSTNHDVIIAENGTDKAIRLNAVTEKEAIALCTLLTDFFDAVFNPERLREYY